MPDASVPDLEGIKKLLEEIASHDPEAVKKIDDFFAVLAKAAPVLQVLVNILRVIHR